MSGEHATRGSMDADGSALIEKAWRVIHVMTSRLNLVKKRNDPIVYTVNDLRAVKETLVFVTHRLTFLEMAVKGLRYRELHDTRAYAKFVEKKHAIEDIEIDQLKELLK